ncbi:MAG: hypothetical protein C4323_01295 [Mastigocladus sp. ERB_26_2]
MKNNNPFVMILLAIAIIFTISKYIESNNNSDQTTGFASQQQSFNYQRKIYIALQTNSPEMTDFVQSFLDLAARQTNNQLTSIDLFAGDKVENLYSQTASRRQLQELIEYLNTQPSSDKALIQAMQRFKDEVEQNPTRPIYGYIVTQGTADPASLAAIRQICEKLTQTDSNKAHLFIIGLAKENRLPMSKAFAPMRKNMQFAGTNQQEWEELMQF